jgi:hypothetical protein
MTLTSDQLKHFYHPSRHILAIAGGIVGAAIPNKTSNIHPFITAAVFAFFAVKIIYGDYDKGYQWTVSDILFAFIIIIEAIVGAIIITQLNKISY